MMCKNTINSNESRHIFQPFIASLFSPESLHRGVGGEHTYRKEERKGERQKERSDFLIGLAFAFGEVDLLLGDKWA